MRFDAVRKLPVRTGWKFRLGLAAAAMMLSACVDKPPSLHEAIAVGDEAAVKRALDGGSDPNANESGTGWTPLHEAAWREDLAAARLLLAAGADPNAANRDGMTPLHSAAMSGQDSPPEADAALLEVDFEGLKTAYAGNPEAAATVELLLDAGANPNVADRDGRTPFFISMALGRGAVAWALDAGGK